MAGFGDLAWLFASYKKYMWFLYRVNTVQASIMSLNYVYLLLQI
ncbi:hypothetical protein P20495_3847 [Pseudoalteromonas sp. BSi20495]|nr:hypothetical protein P20495_3847 [Pseudoalteromonas sp. BSi20495]